MNYTQDGRSGRALLERVKTTTFQPLKNLLLAPLYITPLHSALTYSGCE